MNLFMCNSYMRYQLEQNAAVLKNPVQALFWLQLYCSWCGKYIFKAKGKFFAKSTWKSLLHSGKVCWFGSIVGNLRSGHPWDFSEARRYYTDGLQTNLEFSVGVAWWRFSEFHGSTPVCTKLKIWPYMLFSFAENLHYI